MKKKVETIYFNGTAYRRYPNAKHGTARDYFTSHISDWKKKNRTSLHRDIWVYHNGEIPEGFQIHHTDGNPLNNDISNLECLSKDAHLSRHAEMLGMSVKEYRKHIRKKVDAWNKTPEAKKVKSKQAKGIWKHRQPTEMTCAFCKKVFKKHSTRSLKNPYCSQNCTKKAGFFCGTYALTASCVVCKKEFKHMKCKPKKTCSKKCQSLEHKIFIQKLKESGEYSEILAKRSANRKRKKSLKLS